jgi:hypothetical protein
LQSLFPIAWTATRSATAASTSNALIYPSPLRSTQFSSTMRADTKTFKSQKHVCHLS